MNPDLTVVSVGELKAKDDASASYERFSNKGCYSTVDHGDIIARCWVDGEVRLLTEMERKSPALWNRGMAAQHSLGPGLYREDFV